VQLAPASGVVHTLTMWCQQGTGPAAAARRQFGLLNTDYTSTLAWVRVGDVFTAGGAPWFLTPCNAGVAGGQIIRHDLHQVEVGAYASEVIATSGGTASRAGDQLTCSLDLRASAGTEMRMEFVLKPKGSSSQYAANMTLLFWDASNAVRVNNLTGAVNIIIGGVSYTTAVAASWAAADTVSFWVTFGAGQPTVVKYRIGSGSAVTLSTGSPPSFASAPAPPHDLLASGANLQFSSYALTINPYGTGQQPAWV
jgi:hypothetical protein